MALLEVEVKARVRGAETLAEKLVALGCALSEPKTQDDIVRETRGHDIVTLEQQIRTRPLALPGGYPHTGGTYQ